MIYFGIQKKDDSHRGTRTHDHKIKSLALYHLSYGGLIGDVGWVYIERGGISSIGRVRR